MIVNRTSGAFLLPDAGAPSPPAVEYAGYIGIVTDDMEAAMDYLGVGRVSPYVIIRSVDDVPERLGGMAILSPGMLTPELMDALVRATLGA